jgi:hypothetical protein
MCVAVLLWALAGVQVIILLVDRGQGHGVLGAVLLAAVGSFVYPGSQKKETIKSPIARFLVGMFKRSR